MSIVVVVVAGQTIKAILVTSGIFFKQIVNTNRYLIHFFSKNNIKIHIPKSHLLKFQNRYHRSIFISEEETKDHSTQNCMHYNDTEPNLKKKIINNYIYCSEF